MKENTLTAVPTELICVIDRSGSMGSMLSDAQGGLDAFLAQQREVDGECYLTIWDFDTVHANPVPRTDIREAPYYKIEPRGGTALLDALGKAIGDADAHAKQGHQVIFVIVSDGEENSSREFNLAQVKKLVEQRQGKGWSFAFVGVNIDAFAEGGALGMKAGATLDAANLTGAYAATSSSLLRSRATGQSMSYTSDERDMAGSKS